MLLWIWYSLAKEERVEKEEREAKPQPARRHHNPEVPRQVCNSLSVVSTVFWKIRFTKDIVSVLPPLFTHQPSLNIWPPKYLNWLEMLVRIWRSSVSPLATFNWPSVVTKNWMPWLRLPLLVEVLSRTSTSLLSTSRPRERKPNSKHLFLSRLLGFLWFARNTPTFSSQCTSGETSWHPFSCQSVRDTAHLFFLLRWLYRLICRLRIPLS